MCSTWLWCYFLNNRRDAGVGAMPSTKTSKIGCLKSVSRNVTVPFESPVRHELEDWLECWAGVEDSKTQKNCNYQLFTYVQMGNGYIQVRNDTTIALLKFLAYSCVLGLLLTSKNPATLLDKVFNIMSILCRLPLGHTILRRNLPDSRDEGANKSAETEPSAYLSHLCHAEQLFARISPICYPGTLRFLSYPYSCIIHVSWVTQSFLNTYRASSSFLFLGIAFCGYRLLYPKSSTSSFNNRTSREGFHNLYILGSR